MSRETGAVDEGTGWDEVQGVVAGTDGQETGEMPAQSGLAPGDLASRVVSIKVAAYKPA